MKKWLTSFFLLFSLAGGVLAGVPFHSEKMGMMECCDKAKSMARSPEASIARLCCALNCTDSTPTSSGFASNFAASSVAIGYSMPAQVGETKRSNPSISHSHELTAVSRVFQPKYIQYHSFLI